MPLSQSLLSQHNVPLVYLAKPTFFFHRWLFLEGPIAAGSVISEGTAWVRLSHGGEGLPSPSRILSERRSKQTSGPTEEVLVA